MSERASEYPAMHGTRVSPERVRWNLAPDAMLWEVGSWQGLGREGVSLMRRSGVLISDRDPRQLLHPLLPGETHWGVRRPSVDRPGALTRPRALTLDSPACRSAGKERLLHTLRSLRYLVTAALTD